MNQSRNIELSKFGFYWLTELSAYQSYIKGQNTFILFYYFNKDKNKLIDSEMFLLDKELLKNKKVVKNYVLDSNFKKIRLDTPKVEFLTSKQCFENAVDKIKIKIFPHTILDYFYYTDKRTVTPIEFLNDDVKKDSFKQLTLF